MTALENPLAAIAADHLLDRRRTAWDQVTFLLSDFAVAARDAFGAHTDDLRAAAQRGIGTIAEYQSAKRLYAQVIGGKFAADIAAGDAYRQQQQARVASLKLDIATATAAVDRIDAELDRRQAQPAKSAARKLDDADRAMLKRARAYLDAVAQEQDLAEQHAAASRAAYALGVAFARGIGTDHSRRLFNDAIFRMRRHHTLLRVFETNPEKPGTFGIYNLLLGAIEGGPSPYTKMTLAAAEQALITGLLPDHLRAEL